MSSITTFTTPTSSSTPPPSSSATPDAPVPTGHRAQSGTSLYLYTAVATLGVLLAVAGIIAIILTVLRRRRRAQAAILAATNGTSAAPLQAGRPKVWDVYLDAEEKPAGSNAGTGWADLQPVSALLVHGAGNEHSAPLAEPAPALHATGFLRRPFSGFHRARMAPSLTVRAPGEDASPTTARVQVAVLVAMPASAAPHDGLPVLEIGVGIVRGLVEEILPAKTA